MQGKVSSFIELYNQQLQDIKSSKDNYIRFLDIASNFYKYNFGSQVLIAAQAPKATVCAKFNFWKDINNPVKAGSKGIGIITDNKTISYVFDIRDTIGTFKPNLWEITGEDSKILIENYGVNSIEEYIKMNISEGISIGSNEKYNVILLDTCLYRCLSRCNVSKEELHKKFDFDGIESLTINEIETVGVISTKAAESFMRKADIELNKKVESDKKVSYNPIKEKDGIKEEVSTDDTDKIQGSRGSFNTGSGSGNRATGDSGRVRTNATEIHTGAEAGIGNGADKEERAELLPTEDTDGSRRTGGEDRESTESEQRNPGRMEEHGYSEMGTGNESDQTASQGTRSKGTDIQLEYYDRSAEDKSLPFFNFNNMNKVLLLI